MAELLTSSPRFGSRPVDACVTALAERFDVREVAILDDWDFLIAVPAPGAERPASRPATGLAGGANRPIEVRGIFTGWRRGAHTFAIPSAQVMVHMTVTLPVDS